MSNAPCRHFGIMLDACRNSVPRPQTVEKYIDILQKIGYNTMMLYTEDTYEVDGEPYFGHLRGRYSKQELKRMDAYAKAHGVELIPCIQTLAHFDACMHWNRFTDIRDCDNILMAGDERVYALIDRLFTTLEECFTSRIANVGMDEAHFMGLGNYLNKYGYQDRMEILTRHLFRVSEIAKKHGFSLCMWGDMFFRLASGGHYEGKTVHVDKSVREKIPDNVKLIYWNYWLTDEAVYDAQIREHQALTPDIWFAGGVSSWYGFAPHNRDAQIVTKAAISSCRRNGVQDILLTMWGDDGNECNPFAHLPTLYAAAEWMRGNDDEQSIKAGFEKTFGIAFDDLMLADLPGTPNADGTLVNAEKYLLYADPFMGMFDATLRGDEDKRYAACADKLSGFTDHPTFGYLFRTLETLCRALSYKADLGIRTRAAYLAKDKDTLRALLPVYDDAIAAIRTFYVAFEKQWMTNSKPQGFEVQDARLGGLMQRLAHCKQRLERYIAGELTAIEELEEAVLDPLCREKSDSYVVYNEWGKSFTAAIV